MSQAWELFPTIRIKKSLVTKFGKITVAKSHCFCSSPQGFGMSPYLQELVVFTGQNQVYAEASEQLAKSNLLEISAKQIERITNTYGLLAEDNACAEQESILQSQYTLEEQKTLYCMMDGSMVLSREEDWKEVKLCRLFSEKDQLALSDKRRELRQSYYVGHLGGVNGFFKKLDGMASHLEKAVFIADGAKWIWHWVEDHYPDSTQILDFFHCKEKLCDFAKVAIPEEHLRSRWISIQIDLILEDGIDIVLDNIQQQPTEGIKAAQSKRSLLTYFDNNRNRMQYKSYQNRGYLIGSGAIESAHRTIIQARMKRSGQRWSIRGAQNILNLRTLNKSGNWNIVKNIIAN